MWNKSVSSFVFHDVAGQLDLVLLARTPFSFVPPFQNSSFLSHPCTRTRMERMLTRPNERASTVSFIPIETFQAHPHFVSSHSFASFFFPSLLLSLPPSFHRFSYVTFVHKEGIFSLFPFFFSFSTYLYRHPYRQFLDRIKFYFVIFTV